MTPLPRQTKPNRLSPKWANLPRRRCDNCGKNYKQVRPLRSCDKYGFCKDSCKKDFHKHGGAYRKLRDEVMKAVERKSINIPEERIRELVRELMRPFGFEFDDNGNPLPRAVPATVRK